MSSLQVAKTGLIAFNKAMQMTSHNIANVNTAGFKKSRAVFSELPSVGIPPIGTGVKFNSALADEFSKMLDGNILDQFGDVGFEKGVSDALSNIPTDSIQYIVDKLSAFHNSIQELANDPTNPSVKQNFLGKAEQFVTSVNNFNDVLTNTQNAIESSIDAIATEINSLSNSIADSFRQGQNPLPQLEQLGELIGVSLNDNGQVITDNGIVLIENGQSREIGPSDITQGIGGYAGGLRKAQNESIPLIANTLNNSMSKYMDRVNAEFVQGQGNGQLFDRNGYIFRVVPTDINQVNAGSTTSTGNDVALNMVSLLNQPNQNTTVKSELLQANLTLDNQRESNAGSLERETFFLNHLVDERQEKYGVNLDEEAINMLQYQRAYEAMAKVIQADQRMFNSLMEVV